MCYSPINILNPTKHFNHKTSRQRLKVPCGKCGECRTALQQSFEARVYYEYQACEDAGGYGLFQTFTYDEQHVPRLHGIRCFSTKDYRLFTVNLRHKLVREGKDPKSLKWIWCTEYGGQTYRPHAHAIFFCYDPSITPELLCEYLDYAWARFTVVGKRNDDGSWHRESLGFLDTTNVDGTRNHTPAQRKIDGHGALAYVAKYVCKDLDFEKVISGQVHSSYDGTPIDRLSKEDKKEMFPFHRQSNGLGISMVDLPKKHLIDGVCKVPDKIQKFKYIPLPQYIDRKVFYDYDKNDKCFKLNEEGVSMKIHRFNHNLYSVTKQLTDLYNNVSEIYTLEFSKKYVFLDSPRLFKLEIDNLMKGRSFGDLARYICLYKDIQDCFPDKPLTPDFDRSFLIGRQIVYDSKFCLTDMKDSSVGQRYLSYLQSNTFSKREEFRNFEEVITLFNDLNKYFCKNQQRLYFARQDEKSKLKLTHSLYR